MKIDQNIEIWTETKINVYLQDGIGPPIINFMTDTDNVLIFFNKESKIDELIAKLQEMKGGKQDG